MYRQNSKKSRNSFQLQNFIITSFLDHVNLRSLLSDLKVPKKFWKDFHNLLVPDSQTKIFCNHYKIIKREVLASFHRFSYEDFALAYVAAELYLPIVSYDCDLQDYLHNYLEYTAITPNEVEGLPADSMVLLDSNILLAWIKNETNNKEQISKMISNNHTITFLVPDFIIIEIYSVIKRVRKKETQSLLVPELLKDELISNIGEFIDDWDGFTSYNRQRREEKRKKHRFSKKRYSHYYRKY